MEQANLLRVRRHPCVLRPCSWDHVTQPYVPPSPCLVVYVVPGDPVPRVTAPNPRGEYFLVPGLPYQERVLAAAYLFERPAHPQDGAAVIDATGGAATADRCGSDEDEDEEDEDEAWYCNGRPRPPPDECRTPTTSSSTAGDSDGGDESTASTRERCASPDDEKLAKRRAQALRAAYEKYRRRVEEKDAFDVSGSSDSSLASDDGWVADVDGSLGTYSGGSNDDDEEDDFTDSESSSSDGAKHGPSSSGSTVDSSAPPPRARRRFEETPDGDEIDE